jgi:hypothetical protein
MAQRFIIHKCISTHAHAHTVKQGLCKYHSLSLKSNFFLFLKKGKIIKQIILRSQCIWENKSLMSTDKNSHFTQILYCFHIWFKLKKATRYLHMPKDAYKNSKWN